MLTHKNNDNKPPPPTTNKNKNNTTFWHEKTCLHIKTTITINHYHHKQNRTRTTTCKRKRDGTFLSGLESEKCRCQERNAMNGMGRKGDETSSARLAIMRLYRCTCKKCCNQSLELPAASVV